MTINPKMHMAGSAIKKIAIAAAARELNMERLASFVADTDGYA